MREYAYDDWNDADQAGQMSVDDHYAEVDDLKAQISELEDRIVAAKKFLASLSHPEEFGWAVTQEVRFKAKQLMEDLGGSND